MSKHGARREAGGVTWRVKSEPRREPLIGFDAEKKGHEIGRATQPHSAAPISDEAEREIIEKVKISRHVMAGKAHRLITEALQNIRRRPVELNAKAKSAKAIIEQQALRLGTKEKCRPAVIAINEAHGELQYFLATHKRGPLGENAYAIEATPLTPVMMAGAAATIDAFVNATQFVSVMPNGIIQALVIAGGMSAAMALCGGFAGTGMRFWVYVVPYRRWWWRTVCLGATCLAALSAGLFAQYRAVLEHVAKFGGEASLRDTLSTPPTMMSVTVFVGAAAVFLFSAAKFRGGGGSPWASYGDHAHYDREARRADGVLRQLKAEHFRNIRQIANDAVGQFEEQEAEDRKQLQKAIDACAEAKLEIRDLQKSDEQVHNQGLVEIQRYRNGVMAVRPDLMPSRFRALPPFEPEAFPDVTELDAAVEEMEALFQSRTEQLAAMIVEIGRLEGEAMEEFPQLILEIAQQAEAEQRAKAATRRLTGDAQPQGGVS